MYDTDYSDNWEKKKNRNICCRKNSLLGYLIEQMRPIKKQRKTKKHILQEEATHSSGRVLPKDVR